MNFSKPVREEFPRCGRRIGTKRLILSFGVSGGLRRIPFPEPDTSGFQVLPESAGDELRTQFFPHVELKLGGTKTGITLPLYVKMT